MSIFKLTTEELKQVPTESRAQMCPNKREMKKFDKHLFYEDGQRSYPSGEVLYKSFEEVWLNRYIEDASPISFEEFVTNLKTGPFLGLYWCTNVGALVKIINKHYDEETYFPNFTRVHYEADYSLGDKYWWRDVLEVFELDYKSIGMKRPKKKDCEYFGIRYTDDMSGDIDNYCGLTPYYLIGTRKVEVWEER